MGAERPIFILGCPRSGTTLLQLMLHAHPRIAIPPETRFVLTSYEARNTFGDLRREPNRMVLANSIVRERQTLFYDLGLDADEVFAEIIAGPPTLGSAIGIVFRAYARRFGKPRWGDKRPGYYQYIPALLRMFPDAQIVHLIRDGRDCVASLLTMPWFKQDIYAAICSWIEAIDSGRRAARQLPADTYFELSYEDLVADSPGQLAKLCEFLSEQFDPAMTEPHKIAVSTIPERQTWHADTQQAVTARTLADRTVRDSDGRKATVARLRSDRTGAALRPASSQVRTHRHAAPRRHVQAAAEGPRAACDGTGPRPERALT
jgi:Sulfotransferase family